MEAQIQALKVETRLNRIEFEINVPSIETGEEDRMRVRSSQLRISVVSRANPSVSAKGNR